MLTVYWLSFVIGGVFVLLAVLGGLDGVDFDGLDGDDPFESDVDVVDPNRPSRDRLFAERQAARSSLFDMLRSLKFWTFGICFFGLTGLILSHLSTPLAAAWVAIAAILMGVLCGALVSGLLQALRRREADSLIRTDDVVGMAGIVTLPFDQTSRGKIQLKIKGSQVERVAYTNEEQSFQLGDPVFVVGIERDRLWVVSASSFHASDAP